MSSIIIRPQQPHVCSNIHLFLIYAYMRNKRMLEHVCGRIGLITIEDIDTYVHLVYSITTKLLLPSFDTLG